MTLPSVPSFSSAWRISISPVIFRWARVGTKPAIRRNESSQRVRVATVVLIYSSNASGDRQALRGSGCLTHHLLHLLVHFLGGRLCDMRRDHPGVAFRIDDGSDAISPKHVPHWLFNGSAQLHRVGDHFVHLFHRKV